jgi:hypothetical protein
MTADDIARFKKLGESVRAAGVSLESLLAEVAVRAKRDIAAHDAYQSAALFCCMEARGDWTRSLGFVLFFAGAHLDAGSTFSRETPLARLTEHLDAYRDHGDLVWYVTLLRASRLTGIPMPCPLPPRPR